MSRAGQRIRRTGLRVAVRVRAPYRTVVWLGPDASPCPAAEAHRFSTLAAAKRAERTFRRHWRRVQRLAQRHGAVTVRLA